MPPRHLHNHPRHSLLLALTNDRRLGKTRHLYWDIWQGHNLRPLKRRSTHTGSFVRLCQAELRVKISLPQQLTSASCFLFPLATVETVLSRSVRATQTRTQSWLLLWCCCSGVLFQSPRWTEPRTTKLSKDRAEGNVRARTGRLLLLAAPQWEQEERARRRWVSLRITRFLQTVSLWVSEESNRRCVQHSTCNLPTYCTALLHSSHP